jgi:hypothetical protein
MKQKQQNLNYMKTISNQKDIVEQLKKILFETIQFTKKIEKFSKDFNEFELKKSILLIILQV